MTFWEEATDKWSESKVLKWKQFRDKCEVTIQNPVVWSRYSPEKTPSLIVFSGEYLLQTLDIGKGAEQVREVKKAAGDQGKVSKRRT